MLLILFGLAVGLALLIWSADRFVAGAVALSHRFGIPPIVIGIVVIGFGTSAPELLISTISAWEGNSGLAIGNAIGSNIANIALIIGITAMLTPIVVSTGTLTREFPVLLIATGLTWFLLNDNNLNWLDGLILIGGLFIALAILAYTALRTKQNEADQPSQQAAYSVSEAFLWTFLGLVLLLISSKILVSSSINLAHYFGVSDVIIGLTIVAIGTSLPELAASITGAIKHHSDLAIGNVVGSNIFNTLGVIGVPGLIQSYTVPNEILSRDLPIMLGITLLFMLLSLITRKAGGMHRISSAILLFCFIAFQVTLYMHAVDT